MRANSSIRTLLALALWVAMGAHAQTAPQIVWSAPNPNLLANSIQGVAWAPANGRVSVGSTDRWVRSRNSANGALLFSVLQPHRSGSADQVFYSTDSTLLGVHNSDRGGAFRIHRASDGVFLGTLVITIQPNGVVTFTPDAQLTAATGDTTDARFRIADFSVVRLVGSGYPKIATNWVFSPDRTLQASASQGTITIQRRSDGATVRLLTAGASRGTTPMAFSPDSTQLAAWASTPDETDLFRISDGALVMRFPDATNNAGVVALRFSPGGTRLVTTGYTPFVANDGTLNQRGAIRFFRVADGALRHNFDAGTGIGVTSPVAWSPNFTRFVYGTYEGAAVVAVVPSP
ncbi:WD40 repeat domain-containing protein [Lysobacter sp. KIS68-7]|uniref:WD40 repeat domain-containing protein n=1 Tax=Lysobacter sp. KIS68-7 TaxID=2904252 RepID=UPI001E3E0EA7|nr:WD40 repeat domain-containing protein [Lysobacter sp. KIS68-7]UHQ20674.1 WD40 repeat domain-containing protein [Lysobacter sp. KIS68-7]